MTFTLHKALSLWSTEALQPRVGLCCLSAVNPSYKTPLSFLVFSFEYVGGRDSNLWEVVLRLVITKIFEYPPWQLSACPSYLRLVLFFFFYYAYQNMTLILIRGSQTFIFTMKNWFNFSQFLCEFKSLILQRLLSWSPMSSYHFSSPNPGALEESMNNHS